MNTLMTLTIYFLAEASALQRCKLFSQLMTRGQLVNNKQLYAHTYVDIDGATLLMQISSRRAAFLRNLLLVRVRPLLKKACITSHSAAVHSCQLQ
jgi:hypothetical protein